MTHIENREQKRKLKKRILFGLAGLLLILILGGLLFLQSKTFEAFLLKKISLYLETQYNLTVTAGSLNIRPLQLSAELDNVEIQSAQDTDSFIEHFTAQKFRLNLAASTLLGRKIHIQEVQLIDPRLIINPNPAQIKTDTPVSASSKRPLSLRIDTFLLKGGFVSVQDKLSTISARIAALEINGDYISNKKLHAGTIRTNNGELQFNESRVLLDELYTEYEFDDESVRIKSFTGKTNFLSLSGSGKISNYLQSLRFDLNMEGLLSLDRLKDLIPVDYELAGKASFSIFLEGTATDINLRGNLMTREVFLADTPLPIVRASFQTDTKSLAIDSLEVTTQKGKLTGKIDLDLSASRESTADFQWEGIDLMDFEKWEPRFLPYLSSVSSGRISAKWGALAIDSITAQGEFRFEPSAQPLSDAAEKYALSGNIQWETSSGQVKFKPSSLELNQTRLSLSGTLDSTKTFDTEFALAVKDLSELQGLITRLAAAELFTVNLTDIPFPSAGQFSLEGKARGTTMSPELTVSLKGQDISLNDLEIPQLDGRFTYDHTGLGIPGFSMHFAQGLIQAQGRLSFDHVDSSFGDDSGLTISVDSMDLAPIASSFQMKPSLKGILFGNAEISGRPESLKLKFSAKTENLTLNDEEISLAEVQGRIWDRLLSVEKIQIRKGEGVLEGNLGFDLVSKEFHADITGQGIELADFKTAVPQDSNLSGVAHFKLKGKGTIEKPVFSLQAAVEKITLATAYLERIDATVESDGHTVSLQARIPAGQTILEAKLPLQEPLVLQGRIMTHSLDVWKTLRYQIEALPSPTSSEITATANFSIPVKDWQQSTAQISFEKLGFRYLNSSFQNHQPFSVQLNAREINLEPVQITGPDTEITVSGRIPFSSENTGQIALNGAVNLRIIEAFVSQIEMAGILKLSGDVSGTVTNPVINAQMELKDSHVNMASLPYTLHDMTFMASIQNNVFELEEFAVGVDKGLISARGKIPLPFPKKQGSFEEIMQPGPAQNQITITLSALDLGRFADLLPEKPLAEIGGILDGTIRLGGDIFSGEHIEIEGELSKLELLLDKFKMKNEANIRLHLHERVLRLEDFRLSGGDSFIQADLTLELGEFPRLNGVLSANLNASILTPLFQDIIVDGNLSLDLEYRGTLDDVGLSGKGRITEGLFQLQDFPFLASEIEGDLDLAYGTPASFRLSGMFNGGKTTAQGKFDLISNRLKSAEISVAAEQVQVNYPEGFQGLSDIGLNLSKREQKWFLSGELGFIQSYFSADVYPGSELVKTLRAQQRALKSDIPETIRDVNLDIGFVTVSPFIVDNNLASMEMDSNIRIGGTVFQPRLTGYVRNRRAGEILFGNKSYEAEQVSIDYTDADPLEGRINLIAHTQMRHGYDNLEVTLTISGPITNLNFSLSSSPPRSEIELASLLVTGYGTERLRNEAANILGNQLMLYFLSPLASQFTNRLKASLGADEVHIEPINIATEEDPGARFTFRKGLIHTLDLIYSIDISNTQKQTWILDFSLSRNFGLQSFAKDDGSYGGSVSHRFFLGSPSKTSDLGGRDRAKHYKIKDIVFSGDLRFPKNMLEKVTRDLKKGDEFYYKNLRSAIDKQTAFYKKNNYLNVVISSALEYQESDTIAITLQISPKDPARVVFVGDPVRNSLQKQIIKKWNGRLPEEMSMVEAEKRIRLDLNSKGYIEAEVTASKTEEENESFYALFVHTGPKYRIGHFTISGESAVSSKSIQKTVAGIPRAKGKGLWALLYDFKKSKLRIESLYEEMGFQRAVIDYPEIARHKESETVDITLPVRQGVQSRVHSVSVSGNQNFASSELMALVQLKEPDIFSPFNLAADTNILYNFYRAHGYHDVSIDAQIVSEVDQPQVGIVYSIREGDLHLISTIDITGNHRTPDHVIRRGLVFQEGEPLNMEQIIASQKKLYEMLVFKTVNIRLETDAQLGSRTRVEVEVQEDPRFGVNYGLRYNSEEKLEVFGQLDLINLFGRSRSGLIFYKQNDRQKDLRFSLKVPYIFGKKLNTLYSFSYLDETLSVFKSEEFGLSVQQELSLPLDSTISYLFKLNRVHTYELDPIGPFPFDFTLFLPEFQVFWVRDTRLNRINAKQGSFLSLSSRYSPPFLKTDLTYISFFGQYSFYFPIRPFLIWASNYRIGLTDAFDQVLIPSRRYFAGGANSIRGFEREMVGPYDPYLNRPVGGEALFIMNQELRFPVLNWLEGVAFFDMGNVYKNINDFNPLDVRTAAGFGLRLNIPAIFLRLDYGINLSPRDFERKFVFYFSIGQAF